MPLNNNISASNNMAELNVNDESSPAFLKINHSRNASVISINRRTMLQPRSDRVKDWFKENLILALTIGGVIVGVIMGVSVKMYEDKNGTKLSPEMRLIIAFPGEILMRMLKSLVVPLVTASLISGLAQLDISRSASMGRRAMLYYFATTLIAVVLGIVLVLIIHPGDPEIKKNVGEGTTENRVTTLDAFLDLIRNLFPDNIVQATFMYTTTQYVTKTVKVKHKIPTPTTTPLPFTSTTTLFDEQHGTINGHQNEDHQAAEDFNFVQAQEQKRQHRSPRSPQQQQQQQQANYGGGHYSSQPDNEGMMTNENSQYMIHPNEDNPSYNQNEHHGGTSGSGGGGNGGADYNSVTIYSSPDNNNDGDIMAQPTAATGGAAGAAAVGSAHAHTQQQHQPQQTELREERALSEQFGMNMLGLIMFSIAFGLLLTKMGERGQVVADFFTVVNEIMMQLVMVVVWYSPIGISSLIAGRMIGVENLYLMLINLARYMFTVILGLVIHACIILPTIYFTFTRKNPFTFMKGMLQAWLMALATASSSATIPFSFHCLEAKNGVDMRVSRFVVPIGATVNMDGTALYEAVAAIFIGQMNGMSMDLGKVITISITATLASVGAASIPSAGLVTMIIVLASVGLPVQDVSLIVAVDWLLDRIRTSINVLGDAFGAGIVDHLSKAELAQMDAERAEKNLEAIFEPNIIITAPPGSTPASSPGGGGGVVGIPSAAVMTTLNNVTTTTITTQQQRMTMASNMGGGDSSERKGLLRKS